MKLEKRREDILLESTENECLLRPSCIEGDYRFTVYAEINEMLQITKAFIDRGNLYRGCYILIGREI